MNNDSTESKTTTPWLILEEVKQFLKMGKSTLYDVARKGVTPFPAQDKPGVTVRRGVTGSLNLIG